MNPLSRNPGSAPGASTCTFDTVVSFVEIQLVVAENLCGQDFRDDPPRIFSNFGRGFNETSSKP